MYSLVPESGTSPSSRPFHYVISFFLVLATLVTITVLTGIANSPLSSSSPPPSSQSLAQATASSSASFGGNSSPSTSPYIAIVDAGSAGSRIYLYRHSFLDNRIHVQIATKPPTPPSTLPHPIEKKLEPGLSHYASTGDYSGAAESLEPLLKYVLEWVPEEWASQTPLYVYATAGLRLLPLASQEATLDAIVARVNEQYPFTFQRQHARVITGKEEGLFAWLALNYALGTLHSNASSASTTASTAADGNTAGLVELGGASVQVAMEMTPALIDSLGVGGGGESAAAVLHPDYSHTVKLQLTCPQSATSSAASAAVPSVAMHDDREHLDEGDQLYYTSSGAPLSRSTAPYDRTTGQARTFHLYLTTYLGYGANSARDRYIDALLAANSAASSSRTEPLVDPCLMDGSEEKHGEVTVRGSGQYESCRQMLLPLLNRTVTCTITPCSFNGVHQPVIDSSPAPLPQQSSTAIAAAGGSSSAAVSYMPFYGFSELFYTSLHLFNLTGEYSYSTFSSAAHTYCSQRWTDVETSWKSGQYGSVDEKRVRLQCFKAAWMSVVLHEGLGFRRGTTVDVEAVEAAGGADRSKKELKREGKEKDEQEVVPTTEKAHKRHLLQHTPTNTNNNTATTDESVDTRSQRPPETSQDFGAAAHPSTTNTPPPPSHTTPDSTTTSSDSTSELDDNEPTTSVPPVPPPSASPAGMPSHAQLPPARLHSVSLTPIATTPSGQEVQWTLGAVLMQLSNLLTEQPALLCNTQQNDAKAGSSQVVGRSGGSGGSGLVWFWRRVRSLSVTVLLLLCVLSCVLLLCVCSCMWWWERRRYLTGGDVSWKRNLRRSTSANHIINIRGRW